MTTATITHWSDVLGIVNDSPGCDVARIQRGYSGDTDIWDGLPVTIACYAVRGDDFWHVTVTTIAADGIARAAVHGAFYGFKNAINAVSAVTALIYSRPQDESEICG